MHCILFNHFDAHLVDFEEPTTRVWEWCCWYGLFRMRLACVGCISLVWHPPPLFSRTRGKKAQPLFCALCTVHRTRCGRWKEIEATCVPPLPLLLPLTHSSHQLPSYYPSWRSPWGRLVIITMHAIDHIRFIQWSRRFKSSIIVVPDDDDFKEFVIAFTLNFSHSKLFAQTLEDVQIRYCHPYFI